MSADTNKHKGMFIDMDQSKRNETSRQDLQPNSNSGTGRKHKYTYSSRKHPCPACGDKKGKCSTTEEDVVFCSNHRVPSGYKEISTTKDGRCLISKPVSNESSDRSKYQDWQSQQNWDPKYREALAKQAQLTFSGSYNGLTGLEGYEAKIIDECLNGSGNSPSMMPEVTTLADFKMREGRDNLKPGDDEKFVAVWRNFDGSLFQSKPSHPRLLPEYCEGKIVDYSVPKYETSPKVNGVFKAKAYRPSLPEDIIQKIEYLNDVVLPRKDDEVWGELFRLVRAGKIPLTITEGAKKTNCLLNQGVLAIGIAGVDMWSGKRTADGCRPLIGDIADFIGKRSRVEITFDCDAKDQTVKNVSRSAEELAGVLKDLGAKKVTRPIWKTELGKGVDDLIVAHGVGAYFSSDRRKYSKGYRRVKEDQTRQWHRENRINLREKAFSKIEQDIKKDFELSGPDLEYYRGYAPVPDASDRTVMLSGRFAAGKTEALLKYAIGKKVVVVGPLDGLNRETARRAEAMGIPVFRYQDDVTQGKAYLNDPNFIGILFLCDESFKDYHVGSVDWSNTTVIADEFHSIRSAITKKDTRPEFERAIRTAQRVVVADANLGDMDYYYLSSLRGSNIRRLVQQTTTEETVTLLETATADGAIDRIEWTVPQFAGIDKTIILVECRLTNEDGTPGALSYRQDGVAFDILDKIHLPNLPLIDGQRQDVNGTFLPVPIVADSRKLLNIIREYLLNQGVPASKILLITSDTPEINKEALTDLTGMIERDRPWFVLGSPVLTSGIDCQAEVQAGLAMYAGVLEPPIFMQMLGRFRRIDTWYLSAPRRTSDTDDMILSQERMLRACKGLDSFNKELGVLLSKSDMGHRIGLWNREKAAMYRQFGHEVLSYMLRKTYTSVTVQEFTARPKDHRQIEELVSNREARDVMLSDRFNGKALLDEHKAPATAKDVKDIRKQQAYDKCPELWNDLMKRFTTAEAKRDELLVSGEENSEELAALQEEIEGFIKFGRSLLNERSLAKLRRYRQAVNYDPDHDWQLREDVKKSSINYDHPKAIAFTMQQLFRELNLEALAKRRKDGSKMKGNQDGFFHDSPEIQSRFEMFKANESLQRMFPAVETAEELWAEIKKAMRFFGFEADACSVRIQSPVAVPNGKNRDGSQRLSYSVSRYAVGWFSHAESGSRIWTDNYAAIADSVDKELARYAKNRIRSKRIAAMPTIPAPILRREEPGEVDYWQDQQMALN